MMGVEGVPVCDGLYFGESVPWFVDFPVEFSWGEGREGVHGLVVVLPRYGFNRGGLKRKKQSLSEILKSL